MFKIDLLSKKSIYEQITEGLKGMILSGEYKPGDKIISVRELSTQLTVNPNTIQKAFKELEAQGYINTVTGKGSFAAEQSKSVDKAIEAEMFGRLDSLCREMLFAGIDKKDIKEHVNKQLEGKGDL